MVITWLQNSTQKHNRLIFGFLLVVVGVSFVFYTGSGSQAGALGSSSARYLDIDLADRRATERFDDALTLSGIPPSSESRTYQLCLSIARKHLADQLEIPTPSETNVQQRVRSFFARNGAAGPTPQEWETFVSRLQAELGCGRDEALARLQRVVEDNLRWEKAARLLGGPGHASPQEVRKALEAMDTRWTVEVARLCAIMATELGLDPIPAKRAGLLHDLGKALEAEAEGSHALAGAALLRRLGEDPRVVNAVAAHHREVPPESPFAPLVMIADSISGSRPGARAASLDGLIRRQRGLESLAMTFPGVLEAYALQAGRELRVIVQPSELSDAGASDLAQRLRKAVEEQLNLPGAVRITVIRETRYTDEAR
jgi:putative nucleotidyltransferase with HDIG domain